MKTMRRHRVETQPPVEAVDAETVEMLAEAIAKPGSDALLIDKDNCSHGRVSIREAARSGASFAVELAGDMVGLDVDRREAAHWVRNFLMEQLETRKIPMVVQNSGTPGHLHVFAHVPDSDLKREIETAARSAGCCVRVGQRIRPPLSPHRCGLQISLISPTVPAEALNALARPKPLEIHSRRRSFSGRIFVLLREGDREGKYLSRSEVVQALALAAVNAKLSEVWLLKVCLDPKNRGGEKVQELARTNGEAEAQRYVARVYRNAHKFAAAHPPFRGRSDALAKIDEIERAADVDAGRWKGRAGATDRAVLKAHLKIMCRSGGLEHGASVREIAILAGINSVSTVSAAHRCLERDRYLHCVEKAKGGAAARYVVGLPRFPSRTILPMGALGDCSAGEPSLGADVFRWRGGLGKATWRVWRALNGRTVAELATLLDLKQTSVAKHLAKLGAHELAACDSAARWRRLDNLDAVAKRLGLAGEGARQLVRYEYEREIYQERLRRCPQQSAFPNGYEQSKVASTLRTVCDSTMCGPPSTDLKMNFRKRQAGTRRNED
jgi:hypothetical protein